MRKPQQSGSSARAAKYIRPSKLDRRLQVEQMEPRIVLNGEPVFEQPPLDQASPGGEEPIAYYSQTDPRPNSYGEMNRVFDDFDVSGTGTYEIGHIEWWGAYDRPRHKKILSFTISVWEDDGQSPSFPSTFVDSVVVDGYPYSTCSL